jgi:hypothetical protein
LGFAEIGLIGFFEEQEEVNDMVFGEMQVNHPGAAAFPATTQGYPDFAQPVATHEQLAPMRIGEQLPLKGPVVFVADTTDQLTSEKRRFNKGELHAE